MLRLEVLPAGHGDSLWIEYGDPDSPNKILIDGGARGTYNRALKALLKKRGADLELMVVTHIDADHITGILELLEHAAGEIRPKDVWFNGYKHLDSGNPDTLGAIQGETLTAYLTRQKVPWNRAFECGPAVVLDGAVPPTFELDGGLTLTLLSPTPAALARLEPVWEKEVRKAGMVPGVVATEPTDEVFEVLAGGAPDVPALATSAFSEDNSVPNGSSIALLLEYEGERILMAGDAHPGLLVDGIQRRWGARKLKVSACKLPHHGSKANVSPQLVKRLDCGRYIFSTDGAHFRHPDREGVARVVHFGRGDSRLIFNYESEFTKIWKPKPLEEKYGYLAVFPKEGTAGIRLEFPESREDQ